jgi:site-specific recombinase XerD
VAILEARHGGYLQGGDFVLPTTSRDGKGIAPIGGWSWIKEQLDRRSGVTDWRLHDLRRSLVTIMAEQGADIAVLDSLLNHAASGTRGGIVAVYQKATLIEPMRKLMVLWDHLVTKAIEGGKIVRSPALVSKHG